MLIFLMQFVSKHVCIHPGNSLSYPELLICKGFWSAELIF